MTFACNGDVHWAELNNGLSTEWKVHPEDKVQGMCHFAMGLTHCHKTAFFNIYICSFSTKI